MGYLKPWAQTCDCSRRNHAGRLHHLDSANHSLYMAMREFEKK